MFGVYLGDADGAQGGEITFGAIDHDHFTGSIGWADVVRKGYWEVALEKATLGDIQLAVGSSAAIDTGSSLFAVPSETADKINKIIGGKKSWNGQYMVDCTTLDSLPLLKLHFGGVEYLLGGHDYVLKVGGGSLFGGAQETCISGFMGLDVYKSHLDSCTPRPALDCRRRLSA